jgi:hypothetical protein
MSMFEAKSLEELGLTQEQIFTPEAMEFWKQFSPEEFLINFFYEAMTPVVVLEGYLGLLDKYVDLVSIKIDDNHDAKWAHEVLSKSTNQLRSAFGIMYAYRQHLTDQHKADTDNPV